MRYMCRIHFICSVYISYNQLTFETSLTTLTPRWFIPNTSVDRSRTTLYMPLCCIRTSISLSTAVLYPLHLRSGTWSTNISWISADDRFLLSGIMKKARTVPGIPRQTKNHAARTLHTLSMRGRVKLIKTAKLCMSAAGSHGCSNPAYRLQNARPHPQPLALNRCSCISVK
jgi:hypothetical protein